jgi:hypothetical protein
MQLQKILSLTSKQENIVPDKGLQSPYNCWNIMSYHVISGTLGQSLISNVKGEPVAIDEATAAHIKARIQCEGVTEVSPSTCIEY